MSLMLENFKLLHSLLLKYCSIEILMQLFFPGCQMIYYLICSFDINIYEFQSKDNEIC
jgi:hypothetical protein